MVGDSAAGAAERQCHQVRRSVARSTSVVPIGHKSEQQWHVAVYKVRCSVRFTARRMCGINAIRPLSPPPPPQPAGQGQQGQGCVKAGESEMQGVVKHNCSYRPHDISLPSCTPRSAEERNVQICMFCVSLMPLTPPPPLHLCSGRVAAPAFEQQPHAPLRLRRCQHGSHHLLPRGAPVRAGGEGGLEQGKGWSRARAGGRQAPVHHPVADFPQS